MAEYSKLVITQSGRALIAKIISGSGDITFTKVCSSGATYTEGELESLTELKEIKQTCLVSNVSRTNDVAIKIEAAFSNAELTEGYDMRTLGLYAVDPDEGEILYAVCIETAGSSYMPPCNGVTVSAAYIQLYVAVGNTDNVSLEVNPEAFATIGDIRTIEQGMSALSAALGGKVDKAEGKGLSENDYTTAEKDKLAGIATGTCTTPQGTAAKTVDCPDFELRDGARVMVTFNNGNTSNYMKLNVNGTGEYFAYFPIDGFRAYNNEAISKLIVAGCAYEFIFQEDGSNSKWVYCGVVSTAESLGALSKKDLSNHLGGPGIPIIQSATDSGGLMEIGKYIDFHDAGSQADFDARLYCENGELVSTSPVRAAGGTLSGNLKIENRGQGIKFKDESNEVIASIYCNDGSDHDLTLDTDGSSSVYVNSPSLYVSGSCTVGDSISSGGEIVIRQYAGNNAEAAGLSFYKSGGTICKIPPEMQNFPSITLQTAYMWPDRVDQGIFNVALGGNTNGGEIDFRSYAASGSVLSTGVEKGYAYIWNGQVNAAKFETRGGDYAEYWEYQDSNPDSEDRTGLFVTFTGNKIRIAQKGDNLAKVGVVSACPSVVGDSDQKEWLHKYQKDVYGRDIWEDVEQEDGTVVKDRVLNPAYDETQKYIKRANRPEWDAVGTHGKLVVRDDGTCQPDGFCVPTDGGIATAAEDGFYVMERLDESHIRIYMR